MKRQRSERLLQSLPDKYTPDFVEALDRRTVVGRAITDRIAAWESDLGGADSLSHARRSLIRRAVWMEALAESHELHLAAGREIDVGAYSQAINSLLGVYRLLGIDRKARPVKRLRDALEPGA